MTKKHRLESERNRSKRINGAPAPLFNNAIIGVS